MPPLIKRNIRSQNNKKKKERGRGMKNSLKSCNKRARRKPRNEIIFGCVRHPFACTNSWRKFPSLSCFFIRGTILFRGGEGVSRKIERSISTRAILSVMEIGHIRYHSIHPPIFLRRWKTSGKYGRPIDPPSTMKIFAVVACPSFFPPSSFSIIINSSGRGNRLKFNHGRKVSPREIFSQRISL